MIELLKAAFVQDRLTKDEIDARVDMALTARARAERPRSPASFCRCWAYWRRSGGSWPGGPTRGWPGRPRRIGWRRLRRRPRVAVWCR